MQEQDPRNRFSEAAPIPLREQHARAIYLDLPKQFGAVNTETLEIVAALLEQSNRPHDLECAASARLEAAVFAPNRSIDTLDEDLDTIDSAENILQRAIQAHWQDLEQGRRHPDDQADALRAETHLVFMDVYRDIIGGEISHRTRTETFSKLARIGRYVDTHSQLTTEPKFSAEASGLGVEIATLMGSVSDESDILVPATPREDNGEYEESLTHDFNYLALDEQGTLQLNVGVELKHLTDDLERFKAELRYDRNRIVLIHAPDIGLYKKTIRKAFSHFDLTHEARRDLTEVREGLYQHVAFSVRKWHSPPTKSAKKHKPHGQLSVAS